MHSLRKSWSSLGLPKMTKGTMCFPSGPVTYILGSWVVNNIGQGTATDYMGNWAVRVS